jgi:hypothetical protein
MPEPVFDLRNALENGGVAHRHFGDPIRFNLEFKKMRADENESVQPGSVMAALLQAKIAHPRFWKSTRIPLPGQKHAKGLFNFHETLSPTVPALLSKIGRIAKLHGADAKKNIFQHLSISSLFGLGRQHMQTAPPALDGLVENNANPETPAKGVQFCA